MRQAPRFMRYHLPERAYGPMLAVGLGLCAALVVLYGLATFGVWP